MSSLFGKQINPVAMPPMVGTGTQQTFFDALFNSLTTNAQGWPQLTGVQPYGGQINAPISPLQQNTWSAWSPTLPGSDWLGAQSGTGWGAAKTDPILQGLEQWGGTSGPGTKAQGDTMNYGSPSAGIGQWMHNIAQFGAATPALAGEQQNTIQYGSPTPGPVHDAVANLMKYGATGPAGVPLNNIAQGFVTGPSAYMSPFLPGGSYGGRPYAPPMVYA